MNSSGSKVVGVRCTCSCRCSCCSIVVYRSRQRCRCRLDADSNVVLVVVIVVVVVLVVVVVSVVVVDLVVAVAAGAAFAAAVDEAEAPFFALGWFVEACFLESSICSMSLHVFTSFPPKPARRIHTKDHEQSGHRLRVSLIDCWGRGAIGKVEMMHLFNTNKAQTAAYVGRVLVPASVTTTGNNHWQRLSPTVGFHWRKSDYSDATELRVCVTYSDSADGSHSAMQVRLRRRERLFKLNS